MAIPRFPAIPNILKALKVEANPFQESLDKVIAKKPYLSETISRIDHAAASPDYALKASASFKGIFTGDEEIIKKIAANADSFIRTEKYSEDIYNYGKRGIDGAGNKGFTNNVNKFLSLEVKDLDHNSRNLAHIYEQGISKELDTLGFKYKQSFELLLKNPTKFKQLHGAGQEELFKSVISGKKTGVDEIDTAVGLLNKHDQNLLKGLQDKGINIGNKEGYFLPFNVTTQDLHRLGVDELTKILLASTKLRPKQISALVRSLGNDTGIGFRDDKSAVFGLSRTDFNSPDAAYNFYKTVKGPEFTNNILGSYFHNKQRLLKKAALTEKFGENPSKTFETAIQNAVRKLRKEGKLTETVAETNKIINGHIKDFNNRLAAYNGELFFDNHFWGQLGKAINQSLSFITFSTARSTLRNAIIDGEGHALALGKSLYAGDYEIGGSVGRIFDNFKYLFGQALGTKNNADKLAVNNILKSAGLASSLDNLVRYNLMNFEDFLESQTSATASKTLEIVNKGFSAVNYHTNRLSGNASQFDFLRARRALTFQQMFTNLTKHSSWKNLVNSVTPEERKLLSTYENLYGFNENSFNFLKQVKGEVLKIDNATYKSLGFDSIPAFISKESILDVADDVANKFKGRNQTAKQFKEEVARNWQKLIYAVTDNSAPSSNLADSVTVGLLSNTPSALSVLLRPFLKFGDIANAQFQRARENVAFATYGDTSQYIGFDRSLINWGKVGARYAAYSAATVWALDLLNNRRPRDFADPANAIKLAEYSGFGGFPAQVLFSTLPIHKGRLDVRGVLSGTPAESLASKPANLGLDIYRALFTNKPNAAYNIAKSAHNIQPFSQFWWSKGVIDYTLQQVFLTPSARARVNRRRKRFGYESLF